MTESGLVLIFLLLGNIMLKKLIPAPLNHQLCGGRSIYSHSQILIIMERYTAISCSLFVHYYLKKA